MCTLSFFQQLQITFSIKFHSHNCSRRSYTMFITGVCKTEFSAANLNSSSATKSTPHSLKEQVSLNQFTGLKERFLFLTASFLRQRSITRGTSTFSSGKWLVITVIMTTVITWHYIVRGRSISLSGRGHRRSRFTLAGSKDPATNKNRWKLHGVGYSSMLHFA